MAVLSTVATAEIVQEFGNNPKNTGSSEVQVALLTEKIKLLTEHCNKNKKDFQGLRGLLNLVNERKRVLKYLKRHSFTNYLTLVKKLGLRH